MASLCGHSWPQWAVGGPQESLPVILASRQSCTGLWWSGDAGCLCNLLGAFWGSLDCCRVGLWHLCLSRGWTLRWRRKRQGDIPLPQKPCSCPKVLQKKSSGQGGQGGMHELHGDRARED